MTATNDPETVHVARRRNDRAGELQRRRRAIFGAFPDASQFVASAIAARDECWTEAELWRAAVESSIAPAAATDPEPRKAAGQEKGAAPIVGPGRRLRPGTARSWTVKLLALVGPLILIGGVAFALGVNIGSSRVPAPSAIPEQDAAAYHLSTYPLAQATAVGITFLTECLTHPSPKDTAALQRREATLAAWTTSGTPDSCGWDGTGPATSPTSISADGTALLLPAQTGQTARIGFLVTMSTGETLRVQVPIWVDGASTRIAGPIGIMPPASPAPAPVPVDYPDTDPTLASELSDAVITPFLTAWGASNPVQLDLQLTADATQTARQGMSGQLSGPVVAETRVVVLRGEPAKYQSGDSVTALVTVSWATGIGGQTTSYAIGLRREADRWLITDITGSTLDTNGGAAPLQALPTQQHQRKDNP